MNVPWQLGFQPDNGVVTLNCSMVSDSCGELSTRSVQITLNGQAPFSGTQSFLFPGGLLASSSSVVCNLHTSKEATGVTHNLVEQTNQCNWQAIFKPISEAIKKFSIVATNTRSPVPGNEELSQKNVKKEFDSFKGAGGANDLENALAGVTFNDGKQSFGGDQAGGLNPLGAQGLPSTGGGNRTLPGGVKEGDLTAANGGIEDGLKLPGSKGFGGTQGVPGTGRRGFTPGPGSDLKSRLGSGGGGFSASANDPSNSGGVISSAAKWVGKKLFGAGKDKAKDAAKEGGGLDDLPTDYADAGKKVYQSGKSLYNTGGRGGTHGCASAGDPSKCDKKVDKSAGEYDPNKHGSPFEYCSKQHGNSTGGSRSCMGDSKVKDKWKNCSGDSKCKACANDRSRQDDPKCSPTKKPKPKTDCSKTPNDPACKTAKPDCSKTPNAPACKNANAGRCDPEKDPNCNDTGGGSKSIDPKNMQGAASAVKKKACGGGTNSKTTGEDNCVDDTNQAQAMKNICTKRSEIGGKCEKWQKVPMSKTVNYNQAQPDNVIGDDGGRPK